MSRTVTRAIVAAGVLVATAVLLAAPADAQGWRRRACLAPNGVDDTEALQSALDRCSGGSWWCSVRLCRGVFRTAPLRVGDFRGVLRGDWRGRTVIQALPDLRVNNNPNGYWQDDPLDPGLDPWPFLLQFVGGRGRIQDLTIEIPSPDLALGERPTLGWIEVPGAGESYELAGAILITGLDPVAFDVRRVRIAAAPYPDGFEETALLAGVSFRGLILNPADPGGFPVHPVRGAFSLSESVLTGMLSATQLGELEQAEVEVTENDLQAYVGVDVLDGSRSQVTVSDNQWDAGFTGVNVILNIDGEPSEDNTFLVSGNRGRVAPYYWFGEPVSSGVYFLDAWTLPAPGGSTLVVSRNRMTLGDGAEAAASVVEAYGAGRLTVRGNRFGGLATVGIRADNTSGCRVFWNALSPGLDTAGEPHLHLGSETSGCVAVVGQDDIVDDDGTDNRIFRR